MIEIAAASRKCLDIQINIKLIVKFFTLFTKHLNYSFILFVRKHKTAIFLSILFTSIGSLVCKPEFRIFSDEINLFSISQNIYESKECIAGGSQIYHFDGSIEIIEKSFVSKEHFINKRPILFPYLVNILHLLTGYRYQNVFIINYLCGILILFFLYLLLHFKFGRFWAQTSIIILSSYPLYVWYVNSAGFDILNLLCSLIYFLLIYFFINKPEAINGELLLMWMPILGQSRYESAIAVFPTLILLFYLLPKVEYTKFSFRLYLFPILFLPIAWLRGIKAVVDNSDGVDLNNQFGISNFIENFKQSLVFFFSGNEEYGIIPIISIIALLGFIFFIKKVKIKSKENLSLFIGIFSYYILHLIIKLSFCQGISDFTKPLTSRHSLIFLPVFIFFSIYMLVHLTIKFSFKKEYCIVGLIFMYLIFSHDFSKVYGIRDLSNYQIFKFTKNYLEENFKNKNEFIILFSYPNHFGILGYNSINYSTFKHTKDFFLNYYKNKNFSYFLAIQIIPDNPGLFEEYDSIPVELDANIILEQKVCNDCYIRISKCYPKMKFN